MTTKFQILNFYSPKSELTAPPSFLSNSVLMSSLYFWHQHVGIQPKMFLARLMLQPQRVVFLGDWYSGTKFFYDDFNNALKKTQNNKMDRNKKLQISIVFKDLQHQKP